MYQLLLVDDEPDVLEAIRSLVPWEKYNIKLCGTSKNAVQALEVMAQHPPDLVITDIKMPVVDGIEMIRRARSMEIDAEFIVLSGYDEFEYAKSAMSLGVRYYLLKPCGEKEIAEAVLKAQNDCDVRRKAIRALQTRRRIKEGLLSQSIRLTLQNRGQDAFPRIFDSLLEPEERILLFIFEKREPLSNFSDMLDCLSAVDDDGSFLAPLLETDSCVCGFFLWKGSEPPAARITQLQKELSVPLRYLPEQRYVGFTAYADLCRLLERKAGSLENIRYLDQREKKPAFSNSVAPDEDIERITAVLEKNLSSEEELCSMLLREATGADCGFFLLAGMKLLLKYQGDLSGFTELFGKLYEVEGLEEFAPALAHALWESAGIKERGGHFVEKILSYVDTHLNNDQLSLKWVSSELVFRNEDYVGKAFSAYTGETFSSYLNRKRIERAKLLIRASGVGKLYKVAQQVGLGHDTHYFSKLFKKYTGYSPKEYQFLHGGKKKT